MEYVQPYGGRCCVIYAPPTEFEPFLHHHTTELDAMEVRWRLFARDVLSLVPDDAGVLYFGRPPRPVRGLRLLGVVVHRARRAKPDSTPGAAVDVSGDGRDFGENTRMTGGGGRQSSGSGGSAVAEGDFGLVSIGELVSFIYQYHSCKVCPRGGGISAPRPCVYWTSTNGRNPKKGESSVVGLA